MVERVNITCGRYPTDTLLRRKSERTKDRYTECMESREEKERTMWETRKKDKKEAGGRGREKREYRKAIDIMI